MSARVLTSNCVPIRYVTGLVGSDEPQLQEAAAFCVANVRRLALANERARLKAAGSQQQGATGSSGQMASTDRADG